MNKLKNNAVKFKDDDYETQKETLESLLPFIEKYNIIYDPFYCQGTVKTYWEELDKECINEKLDAFNRDHPECDIVISNIPFSIKKECMELFLSLDKPFIILMPIAAMGSKWISPYFDKLQFIIPNKRINFLKNKKLGNGSWFDCCFYCYGLNLEKDIIKL
tara:strand:+ start:105 stop:587 length:483 start_codon:yes stop_codon:yes gene_type:complete